MRARKRTISSSSYTVAIVFVWANPTTSALEVTSSDTSHGIQVHIALHSEPTEMTIMWMTVHSRCASTWCCAHTNNSELAST